MNFTYTNILTKFFNEISDIDNTLDLNDNVKINTSLYDNNDLYNIPDIHNYDDQIIEHITQYKKYKFLYSFQTNKRNINILFIIIDDPKKHHNDILEKLMYIKKWFHFIDNYTDSICSKNLNVYFFILPILKMLPTEINKTIGKINVNSAFTYSCKKNNNIHLYRNEEWFKVLIHESFHALGLDFSNINNNISNTRIAKIFPLNIDFYLYETYCECWALIFNCIFVSYKQNHSKSVKNFIKLFKKNINTEINFSSYQTIKILHHYGLTYHNLYSDDNASIFSRIHKYKEDTPVMSYYIIKSIIINFYEDFLIWCANTNDNIIKFHNKTISIDKHILSFIKFISKKYKSASFINKINESTSILSDNINDLNKIYNTRNLRMSILDM